MHIGQLHNTQSHSHHHFLHMEDHHHHYCPLLHRPTTTATATTSSTTTTTKFISSDFTIIILRLLLVVAVGIISIWANYEASKGFEIRIENAAGNSPAGRRFQLFYVSDDKATRLVLSTSEFVETLLYHHANTGQIFQPKKKVNSVTLRLTRRNLTSPVNVETTEEGEFMVRISPSVMEVKNVDLAVARAVQKGMTLVWLYRNNTPVTVLNGIAEYVSSLAGLDADVAGFSSGGKSPESVHGCWKDENPKAVASFFHYCEVERRGFIQRLNQAMRGGWDNQTVDKALEMPARHLCKSFLLLRKHRITESW